MPLFLERHLLGERTQRRILGAGVHLGEELVRAALGVERDGERVARREQAEHQLARHRLRRARVEPGVLARPELGHRDARGPRLQGVEVLGLVHGERAEQRRDVVVAHVGHELRQLGVALGGLALDGDGVRVELGRRADRGARHGAMQILCTAPRRPA
jgi:hypothetical protein